MNIDIVSEQIDKAFADFPFESRVKEVVYHEMTKSIEAYFKYGKGADVIKKAVEAKYCKGGTWGC